MGYLCRNLDCWCWAAYGWSLEHSNLPTDEAFDTDYDVLASYFLHDSDIPHRSPAQHFNNSAHGVHPVTSYIVHQTEQSGIGISSPAMESSNDALRLLSSFRGLPRRAVPSDTSGLQLQDPRSDGDLYTSPFIKGEGVERMGWCSFCSSWHKLKDSAYWYHLHYSHGVTCFTGRQMIGPEEIQWNSTLNGWQGLCPRCNIWLTLGKGDRAAKTAYYRHAYQCQVRSNPQFDRSSGARRSRSPLR